MPRLLTVPEAAAALGVSPDTVRRYGDDGRLPYVRYGSGRSGTRRLIPEDAVAAFIAAHTHSGPS